MGKKSDGKPTRTFSYVKRFTGKHGNRQVRDRVLAASSMHDACIALESVLLELSEIE